MEDLFRGLFHFPVRFSTYQSGGWLWTNKDTQRASCKCHKSLPLSAGASLLLQALLWLFKLPQKHLLVPLMSPDYNPEPHLAPCLPLIIHFRTIWAGNGGGKYAAPPTSRSPPPPIRTGLINVAVSELQVKLRFDH